jgi:hypothetical protein
MPTGDVSLGRLAFTPAYIHATLKDSKRRTGMHAVRLTTVLMLVFQHVWCEVSTLSGVEVCCLPLTWRQGRRRPIHATHTRTSATSPSAGYSEGRAAMNTTVAVLALLIVLLIVASLATD